MAGRVGAGLPRAGPQAGIAPPRPVRLPVRPVLGLALQRQQKLAIPIPRPRPDRGAGMPHQTSSMRSTSRTSSNPPFSGNAPPPGIRTWAAASFRSILRISAPSPSRIPESEALPTAASAASGSPSGDTMPSGIPARAQNGAIGPSSAYGFSQACMPQSRAAASAPRPGPRCAASVRPRENPPGNARPLPA